MVRAFTLVSVVLLMLGAIACDSDEVPEGYELVSNVGVALGEWSITATPNSVPAGLVRFDVSNGGPADPHELVIFRTDLPQDELERIAIANPEERGFLPEEGVSGVTFIGEVEEFDVGQQRSGVFELSAGNYAFICNIVEHEEIDEDGNPESHLLEGMYTTFTVN
ncbi:MAG: hypothetical protein OXN15_08920 [Chloroflexota bacterium]|nr:hypothetical protein [Chloroflexota bacterium]MDE2969778.1 hypothetical protein [Chloroflexota bacterium]